MMTTLTLRQSVVRFLKQRGCGSVVADGDNVTFVSPNSTEIVLEFDGEFSFREFLDGSVTTYTSLEQYVAAWNEGQPLTAKEVRKALRESGLFDSISHKDGVWTVRRTFFYTHGQSGETLFAAVKGLFLEAKCVETQTIWKPFRGGASVAASSHFLCRFTL